MCFYLNWHYRCLKPKGKLKACSKSNGIFNVFTRFTMCFYLNWHYRCLKPKGKLKACSKLNGIFNVLTRFTSPWYNRTSWLGVKHQLTYLLGLLCVFIWIGIQFTKPPITEFFIQFTTEVYRSLITLWASFPCKRIYACPTFFLPPSRIKRASHLLKHWNRLLRLWPKIIKRLHRDWSKSFYSCPTIPSIKYNTMQDISKKGFS